VPEWLGSGLQNRLHRFNSGRHLHEKMNSIRAVAHTNIALIKYWGKKAGEGNLPAVGSLSLTLNQFYTTTTVTPSDCDSFVLDATPQEAESERRVFAHIDFFRKLSGKSLKFAIHSRNSVPTRSGLASSASGFAALTLALAKAFDLNLMPSDLSRIARRGSGSAARSIFGGFALMHGGPDTSDVLAFAEPIESPLCDTIAMIVLECARGAKTVGSRDAMQRVTASSIFYPSFLANHPRILASGVNALEAGDLSELGRLMEQSTMQMHATMLGCSDPFWYFNSATIAALDAIRILRAQGHSCFFTMDAGPHVKVLCMANDAQKLAAHLENVDGVLKATVCHAGPGAYLS
jgi:diphosphomevalonate decarboxylase